MRLVNYLLVLFTLLFAASCTEECKTITKYMDPVDLKFNIGQSVTTYSNYKIKLSSINFYKTPPTDTLVSKDSVINADNCTFEIMKSDSTDKVSFTLSPNNYTEYGKHDDAPSNTFSPIKIFLNAIDLKDSTVSITIWNSTFLQDCGDWE